MYNIRQCIHKHAHIRGTKSKSAEWLQCSLSGGGQKHMVDFCDIPLCTTHSVFSLPSVRTPSYWRFSV